MFKEYIESFTGNVYRRFTNPFLGTFIVIFLLYNWKALYALFTINSSISLENRINKISNLIITNSLADLSILVFKTFAVMVATYVLLWISSSIADFYSQIALPYIKKKISPHQIVDRELFNNLNENLKSLDKENSSLNENNALLSSNIKNITTELISLQVSEEASKAELELSRKKYKKLQNQYNEIIDELSLLRTKMNEFDSETYINSHNIGEVISELESNNLLITFINMYSVPKLFTSDDWKTFITKEELQILKELKLVLSGEDFLYFTKLAQSVYSTYKAIIKK